MNSVVLIGRLTKDPDLRYIPESQMAIATFTLAVDRPMSKEKKADFIRITVFGRQAENCSKYLSKGRQTAVEGSIQTGSYTNKNGETVYTTDVVANRVEFLSSGDRGQGQQGSYQGQQSYQNQQQYRNPQQTQSSSYQQQPDPFAPNMDSSGGMQTPPGFSALDDDDDVPF